jgi:hypothetical protein
MMMNNDSFKPEFKDYNRNATAMPIYWAYVVLQKLYACNKDNGKSLHML